MCVCVCVCVCPIIQISEPLEPFTQNLVQTLCHMKPAKCYFLNILHTVIKAVAYMQTCQGSDTGSTHFRILKSYIRPNLHQKMLGICRM